MIQISGWQARGTAAAVLAFGLLAATVGAPPAAAARVEDLYAAAVPLADASPEATRGALVEALRRVLVKVTGRSAAAQDPAVIAAFGDPEPYVQRFRRDGAGNLWAQFDAAAVRRVLGKAGLPVWGDNRPATLVWLAYDTGGGERDVLPAGGPDAPAAAALRRDFLATAAARAVPVMLPLRDSQDLAAATYADLWGDFTEPVMKASARYQADAVLIGRARLYPPGMTDVRWTLLLGEERLEWRGDVAAGPQGLAEHLAQRLASAGAAGGAVVRLSLDGIRSLDDYGTVLGYLHGLDVVESASLSRASDATLMFDLKLRGDRERLARALAVGRVFEPAAGAGPAGWPPADLAYRYVAAP